MSRKRPYVELHVPDFSPVRAFYGMLNFEELRSEENEQSSGYLVMALEENLLAFWGGNGAVYAHPYFSRFPENASRGVGVEVVLFLSNLPLYYEEISRRIQVLTPKTLRPWGVYDFRVVDPNGYYLRFSEPHDVTAG